MTSTWYCAPLRSSTRCRPPGAISAEFHGIPPDTFKAGAEVIAAGVLASDGHLQADKIETKCPSKYEAK